MAEVMKCYLSDYLWSKYRLDFERAKAVGRKFGKTKWLIRKNYPPYSLTEPITSEEALNGRRG